MSHAEEPRDAPKFEDGEPPAFAALPVDPPSRETRHSLDRHPGEGRGPVPSPPPLSIGRDEPLAPAWIKVQQLSGLIWTAVLAGSAAVLLVIAALALERLTAAAAAAILVAITALLLVPAVLWPRVAYRHRSYRFEEDEVHLRQGVLWRSQIAVPRSRIQHTDVSQGPFERLYGLATLTLHTAGNHYAAVSLPGLEHGLALAARDFLLAARAPGDGDAV